MKIPHGRANDEWVIISGVKLNGDLNNKLNGSHKINIPPGSAPTYFEYLLEPAPQGTVSGDVWVDRSSSHWIRVQELKQESAGSKIAKLTAYWPHNRKPGQNVIVGVTSSAPEFDAYRGTFEVRSVDPNDPKVLTYEMKTVPAAGQVTEGTILISPNFHGLSGGAIASVQERNYVLNCRLGGPYQDTWSKRELIVRDNVYLNVVTGPAFNLAPPGGRSDPRLGACLVRNGTTATFTTAKPHGLETNDKVRIHGALAYKPGHWFTYFNDFKGEFTITKISDTKFGYNLPATPESNVFGSPLIEVVESSGSTLPPPAVGTGLIRDPQNAARAIFSTIKPHGLETNAQVVISGALLNGSFANDFNGSFTITKLNNHQFSYDMAGDPGGNAGGSPVLGAVIAAQSVTRASSNPASSSSRLAVFTAASAHGLSPGEFISVFGVKIGGSIDNPYNGVFQVLDVGTPNANSFRYWMEANPGNSADANTGSCGRQVCSPIFRITDTSFTLHSVEPHGFALGDLISIVGALPTTVGNRFNPFTRILAIVQKGDDWIRVTYLEKPGDPPFGQISFGLAVGSAITSAGSVATFHTALPHGIKPGDAVVIANAKEDGVPSTDFYEGTLPVLSSSEFSFEYRMEGEPTANALPTAEFAALWQVGFLVVENNFIQLRPPDPPSAEYGPPAGIFLYSPRPAQDGQFRFRRLLFRGNFIQELPEPDDPAKRARAVSLADAGQGILDGNVIAVNRSPPIEITRSHQITCFNNQRPSGKIVPARDVGAGTWKFGLERTIEDALSLGL
jgi:hypothetical protein